MSLTAAQARVRPTSTTSQRCVRDPVGVGQSSIEHAVLFVCVCVREKEREREREERERERERERAAWQVPPTAVEAAFKVVLCFGYP